MILRAFTYLMIAVLLLPIGVILATSFTTAGYVAFPPEGFTLRWYGEALKKQEFLDSFYLSLLVGAVTAAIATVLGTLVAVGIVRHRFPGRELINAFFMSPLILPTIVIGVLVYWRPELILSVVSSSTAASFEDMYSPSAHSIGRIREASTDWMMFGYYIRNNISVAFQCFGGGLFGGLGTLFFLAYNGAFGGAIAGYLTERGLSSTFYPFIATHSAFELTAIVLAGAAGLRLGHSLIAPGRSRRLQSLVAAAETKVRRPGETARPPNASRSARVPCSRPSSPCRSTSRAGCTRRSTTGTGSSPTRRGTA